VHLRAVAPSEMVAWQAARMSIATTAFPSPERGYGWPPSILRG